MCSVGEDLSVVWKALTEIGEFWEWFFCSVLVLYSLKNNTFPRCALPSTPAPWGSMAHVNWLHESREHSVLVEDSKRTIWFTSSPVRLDSAAQTQRDWSVVLWQCQFWVIHSPFCWKSHLLAEQWRDSKDMQLGEALSSTLAGRCGSAHLSELPADERFPLQEHSLLAVLLQKWVMLEINPLFSCCQC